MAEVRASVEIRDVVKRFDGAVAVDGVSLDIRKGEFFALLGPSGCGKTTLLRMIAGFEFPDSGGILLQGRDMARVPPNERPVNMVFQHYALFPHMTVRDNIAFGLRMRKVPEPEALDRVEEILGTVQLSALGDRYSSQLSGGQQQRVALARALVNRPEVLLLDEPLAALDERLRKDMRVELKALQASVGISFVYVTHDQEEALALADRVAVMQGGRVMQLDTPQEVYEAPRSRFVADFVGHSNIMEGRVAEVEPLLVQDGAAPRRASVDVEGVGRVDVLLPDGVEPGARVLLALRPERIHLSTSQVANLDNRLPARVESTIFLGGDVHYRVRLSGGREMAAHEISSPIRRVRKPGERVYLQWRAQDAKVLQG